MKVALAQMEPVFGDWNASFLKHKDFIERAIEDKASLIVFPEMSMTGYHLKDLTHELCVRPGYEKLRDIVKQSMQIDVVIGFPEMDENFRCYISSAYCSKGEIIQIHRKIFLPINGMFNDSKNFTAGRELTVFHAEQLNMGLLICRDMWHEEAVTSYVKKDVQCLLIPSNISLRNIDSSGPSIDSFVERMVIGYAEKNAIYVIYVNRVGFEEGICFYGGSMVADPFGKIVTKSPFLEESLLYADVDPLVIERKIRILPLHYDRKDSIVRDAFREISHE